LQQKYATEVVLRAFSAIRDEKIGQAVKDLPEDLCDTAMKYVYRFLQDTTNCGSMLKWHSALTKKAGVGGIVRVMTDRRTV
jgi:actin related protein 2/3 complex subunit 5